MVRLRPRVLVLKNVEFGCVDGSRNTYDLVRTRMRNKKGISVSG